MLNILSQEATILSGTSRINLQIDDNGEVHGFVKDYLNGAYEDILRSDVAKTLLQENTKNTDDLVSLVKTNIECLLLNPVNTKQQTEFEILVIAAASLQLFVQNNWLGPLTTTPPTELINKQCIDKVNKQALSELSVDGEPVYNLTRFLPYLFISHTILLDCRDFLEDLQTSRWWLLRCLYIQQEVLDDRSSSLRSTILELIDDIAKQEPLFSDDKYRDQVIEFHVEAGHICHIYFEYKLGSEHFNRAKKLSQLDIQITGAMGKRTRFQQDDKAQLVLQVKRLNVKVGEDAKENLPLPKNILLDDDTVLNDINFTNKDREFSPQLSPLEQTVVLGCMEGYRRSMASERLTDEEVLTYLNCLLTQLCNWNVGIYSLMLRSRLEKDSRRRVERSMTQLEELVNVVSLPEPCNTDRSYLFYSGQVPSIWNLKKELGQHLKSLGCISAAKDLYESLEMWEDAIVCYQQMGKIDQAEVIIKEQLLKQETPNLYCFLGDVTRDLQWYQKAWELSNQRSARAMRCMGYLYFGKEDFESALTCFEKALEINSLQIPVWFTYGCVALTTKKYEKAVKAFKRCVTIDSDNYEAWNNMGTAYIRLKDKPKAFKTMKEAIKCNYQSWQVWENIMVIGIDCGEFDEVIAAYHRLIDLKQKWVDEEILRLLVRSIEEDLEDSRGQPAKRIQHKLQKLFGRITSKTTGNGEIWRLYAKLILLDKKPENIEKGLQYLQKSHRCIMQTSNWEKEEKIYTEVSSQASDLANLYIQCSEAIEDKTQKIQNLSSAKLMLKGVVTKLRQHHTDPVTQTLNDSLLPICTDLDNQLQNVIEQIDELRND